MDVILDQVKRLGKGCLLYKVDISIAFRHIKLDPHDYDLLGLRDVCHYLDTCLPFGFRHRSALFQRLSDAVRHIMCQDGYDVINYASQLPPEFGDFNIVHLEMLNILVALRVWGDQWSNQKIKIVCDNEAMVAVINSGKTKDRTLAAIVRNIKFSAALANVDLHTVHIHIMGRNNVVTDLSRWHLTTNPYEKLFQLMPVHQWLEVPTIFLQIDWSI